MSAQPPDHRCNCRILYTVEQPAGVYHKNLGRRPRIINLLSIPKKSPLFLIIQFSNLFYNFGVFLHFLPLDTLVKALLHFLPANLFPSMLLIPKVLNCYCYHYFLSEYRLAARSE